MDVWLCICGNKIMGVFTVCFCRGNQLGFTPSLYIGTTGKDVDHLWTSIVFSLQP